MIIIYLYNVHRDRKTPTNILKAKRQRVLDIEDAGIPVHRYHHWYFKPEYMYPNLYRLWVEFETEEEAALFKLTWM